LLVRLGYASGDEIRDDAFCGAPLVDMSFSWQSKRS
jgi:hypothetical protein